MDLATPIRIGGWTARPALNVLECAERSVKLEPRTMNVLAYLADRPGEVVSVDELLSNVWRGVVVGDGSVYLAIKQLRQALSRPGDDTAYIETIPKRGYRLRVPVERLAAEPLPSRTREAPALPRNSGATANETAVESANRDRARAVAASAASVPTMRDRWLRGALLTVAIGVAGGAFIGAAWVLRKSPTAAQPPTLHLEFHAPRNASGFAVSPDGRHVVYRTLRNGVPELWLRRLDAGSVRRLAGTEMGVAPFWSPDGSQIAFTGDLKLRRVAIDGGAVLALADTPRIRGFTAGTWSARDVILFASEQYDIARVSAQGGVVEQATVPSSEACDAQRPPGAARHIAPRVLPGGDRFLYLEEVCGTTGPGFVIYSASLTSGERIRVATLTRKPAERPRVVIQNIDYANGFLLWLLDGTLMAQRLDADALQLRGEAVSVAEEVGEFSVSQNGVLVYRETRPLVTEDSTAPPRKLVRYDRSGQRLGEVRAPARYRLHRVSPDGRRIAATAPMRRGAIGETDDIWTVDVERGAAVPLTTEEAGDTTPVWSRDGAYLAFTSGRGAIANRPSRIYRRAADGTGADELLFAAELDEFASPLDWSSDGRYLLFARGRYATWRNQSDLWVLPLAPGESAFALLESPHRKRAARLSSDGRFIAYSTNESGRDQVVVQPFPNVGAGSWQVSTGGGYEPRWRNDGRELFYLAPDGTVMAAETQTAGAAFERGEPRALFATGLTITGSDVPPDGFYDVTADGQQFFVAEPIADAPGSTPADAAEQTVHVIVNWQTPLQADSGR